MRAERLARLAAMSSNAGSVQEERKARLEKIAVQEQVELEAEERVRAKSGGTGSFLHSTQKVVFGGMEGGLGEQVRRGRATMRADAD